MADADAVLFSPTLRRRASYGALGCLPSRVHGGVTFSFEKPSEEEPRHSLDACFLCRRPLGRSSDVFMYRGDTPFCSEECRQEQIELDEAREREISDRARRRHHPHPAASVERAPALAQQSLCARAPDAVVAS